MRKMLLSAAALGGTAYLMAHRQRARRRIDFHGRRVLITGGSRGLGLEMARLFAHEGARLILLARDADELERARRELSRLSIDVLVYACDVGDRAQVEHTVGRIVAACGGVDVLVNNAGIIQVGPIEHMTDEDFARAMAVHVWGPLHLIRAVLPHLPGNGEGRIVNIASIGGLVAIPHLIPYSTSKFALVGLSDGLRAELARQGVRITTVCPGLMRTGSHVNALFKGQHAREYTWFTLAAAFPLLSTDAPSAARQIVEACRYGDARLVITPQARLLDLFDTLFPGSLGTLSRLAARLLPAPTGPEGDRLQSGKASDEGLTPSVLTHNVDEAAARNNEV